MRTCNHVITSSRSEHDLRGRCQARQKPKLHASNYSRRGQRALLAHRGRWSSTGHEDIHDEVLISDDDVANHACGVRPATGAPPLSARPYLAERPRKRPSLSSAVESGVGQVEMATMNGGQRDSEDWSQIPVDDETPFVVDDVLFSAALFRPHAVLIGPVGLSCLALSFSWGAQRGLVP